ncbi:hypothetical protein AHiyo8_32960 [Arthrobacter sp. Hiyo8]|nr:hypothetical protein AHiyo8_32960 [Arthrobacter sp. Hiyo8]
MAAAVARALTRRLSHSVTARIQGSLIGTANLLYSLTPPTDHLSVAAPNDFTLVETSTDWDRRDACHFRGESTASSRIGRSKPDRSAVTRPRGPRRSFAWHK